MDISSALSWIATTYPATAATISVVCTIGFVFVHIFPMLPKPTAATGAWAQIYAVLSFIAGNWGAAANTIANLPPDQKASVATGAAASKNAAKAS